MITLDEKALRGTPQDVELVPNITRGSVERGIDVRVIAEREVVG
jgi:hypothetical protein